MLRKTLEKHEQDTQSWHKSLRDIEASPEFAELQSKLDLRLAAEKSAAARYRVLQVAGLTSSLTLARYRRGGFRLSGIGADAAMQFLKLKMPKLEKLIACEEEYSKAMRDVPKAIRTEISGLEA